jgi:hypothetical protein
MKNYLFLLIIFVIPIISNAQTLSITSNDMVLCPGESATLTATADLPNRVLNFNRVTGQTIILSNVQQQAKETFSYEFWFNTPDSIVLLQEHVDGIGIYDGQAGQNYALYPQSIFSGLQRRSSGISVGKNGISVMEFSHDFSASRLTYVADLSGWHHCAVVYTLNNFELFIDGVSVGTRLNGSNYANNTFGVPLTVAFRPNLGNFYPPLGGIDADPNDGYLGQLDEFRVWKIALSAADVSAIYQRKLISANMQNVIVHMPFDMGSQANFSTITSSPAITIGAPGATSGVTFPSAAIPQIGTFAGTSLPAAVYNPFVIGYVWNGGAIGNTLVVSPTAASTTYTCSATAGTSNSTATISIAVSNPTASISSSDPLTFCADTSATLTANLGTAYMWNTGDTTSFITVDTTGIYTVAVTNSDNCVANSAGTSITVNPLPTPIITPLSATTFCEGDSVLLASSIDAVYLWSDNSADSTLLVYAAGDYTVTQTNNFNCSATSAAVTVVVNPNPIATIVANGPTSFCSGNEVQLTSTIGIPSWSTGSGDTTIAVVQTEIIELFVMNEFGCSDSNSISVTVNPIPNPVITPLSATAFCDGDSVLLSSSLDSLYFWNTNSTDSILVVSSAGDYTVTLTNSFNCSATSDTLSVFVNPNPIATIVANGPTSFCLGNEVQLTSTIGIPSWSTGSSDTTITVIQTEMIQLLVTNEFGCTDTDSLGITVFELPIVTAAADTSVCISNGPFALNATPDLGTWTGVNVSNNTFAPTTEGTFGFQYSFTDGNGCTNIDSTYFTIAVPLQITAGPDVNVCMPSDMIDLAFNASPVGGAWSGFGVTAEGTVIPILSGSYAYAYSFQNLCATSDTVYVNSYDAPAAPVIGGELFFCKNVASPLWSNYVGGNLWTTTDASDTIYIVDEGTYGVTQTDIHGCSSYSEVSIQQYPEPQIPSISGEPNALYNNTYSYAVASLLDYTYNWTVTGGTIVSGQGTNVIEVVWDQFITGVGEIQMTWTNVYGCESTQFYAVSVDVSVQEIFASNLRIYPNPTRDIVNIQWDFMNENTYLSLFENTGKLISTQKLNNQTLHILDLSGYENGVYQLRLSNENAVIVKAIAVAR